MGDLVLLIVLTGGTILIATWISGAETVEELSTDGFFEASNADDEQFGVHVLEQFIRDQHTLPPDELIKKLYRRVKSHAAGEAQGDDLTALIVKRTMT
jgi:hypothetical protein